MPHPPLKTPPRYVPTLTQVVDKKPNAGGAALRAAADAVSEVNASEAPERVVQLLRQQLLVQTRQYMDVQLQKRIREAVAQLALEHAHKIFEELQPQLESTIAQVVDEAIQHAVSHAATHAP